MNPNFIKYLHITTINENYVLVLLVVNNSGSNIMNEKTKKICYKHSRLNKF